MDAQPAGRLAGRSTATARPAATATASRSAGTAGSAARVLSTLTVRGWAPLTGYARDRFGAAWYDADGNGCDTRDDVLRRDLGSVRLKAHTGGCVVAAGVLADPYSGRTVRFTRGIRTSAVVQIDHVVALADAWRTGAQRWTADRRRDYANDPLVLLAADGVLNEQKGDGDAATWLPPDRAYRCAYVARQVAVKARYGLSVTPAEKAAMGRVLASCPDRRLPTEAAAVVPAPGLSGRPPAAP